ncbi:MAG TPA: hypothetical protein VNT32_09185 [Thermoleophilaceae bacterium]|nr:hypothetical protein [Thermoleophilaceae bacterium]
MTSRAPLLLTVPNVSEGRDAATIEALAGGFGGARLLDVHSDPDHNRSVFTFAARQGEVAPALASGAARAAELIDLSAHTGAHPHVGALDVAPVVHLSPADRGAAVAEALTAATLIGEAGLPVFLYGDLATREDQRERSVIRRGGPEALAERIDTGHATPDFGPARANSQAGCVLVTARPPLVAFNVDLVTGDVGVAKRIAASIREAGGGFPGVRALGIALPARGRAQVSMNVHDHERAPLAEIVGRIAREADIAEAELVGLAPRAAFEGFPEEIPLRNFDPERHLIENALGATGV